MSNQIILERDTDYIGSGEIVFVKATFTYVPFFNPSTDTYRSFFNDPSLSGILQLIDVRYDSLNHPTFMLLFSTVEGGAGSIPVKQIELIVMNILQNISSSTTRLFGIQLSSIFETSDDQWPDSSSTDSNTGNVIGDPTSNDLGKQAKDIADALTNAAKGVLPSSNKIIIILIIVVIGIIGLAYFAKEV